MRKLIVVMLLLGACGTSKRAYFAAYADDNVMVVTVTESDGIKQRVVHSDPENYSAYRVVTGPVSEMKRLLALQGIEVGE